MASFGMDTRPVAAGEGALSFLSQSLREDLRLIRARAGELETFLSAPVPEPNLLARLRRAYTTTSSAGSGSTQLNLSAIGKAFEAKVGRGWGTKAKADWRWEEEDAGEWEPIRAVKARLRDLDQRRQDQATDVLHKVKLSLLRHDAGEAQVPAVQRGARQVHDADIPDLLHFQEQLGLHGLPRILHYCDSGSGEPL